MCLVGLLCVLGGALLFGLDRDTAAGLAAGGLTQSAIIGTAGDAISNLHLSAAAIKTMQTNVAVGYAVCYIFGSLGPILMVTWFLPAIKKWDIRQEALKLAATMSGGQAPLEPGEFDTAQPVVTRFHVVAPGGAAAGHTALEIDQMFSDAAIEAVMAPGRPWTCVIRRSCWRETRSP